MKNKQLYLKATEESLENAFDLFEEAALLHDKGKYPRAFALCLLSLEEMTKSFVYRCVSVDLIREEGLSDYLIDHREKLLNSGHLMLQSIINLDHLDSLKKAVEHDHNFKDHKDHKFLDVLSKCGFDAANSTIETLENAQDFKNDSFYVNIRDGNIILPKNTITKEKCFKTFSNAGKMFSQVPYLIQGSDEEFAKNTKTFLWSVVEGIKKEIENKMKKKRKKK